MNGQSMKVIKYGLIAFVSWFAVLMFIRVYLPHDWQIIKHEWREQVRSQNVRFHNHEKG